MIGLEARREFDSGELRERRHVTLPPLAGLGGKKGRTKTRVSSVEHHWSISLDRVDALRSRLDLNPPADVAQLVEHITRLTG